MAETDRVRGAHAKHAKHAAPITEEPIEDVVENAAEGSAEGLCAESPLPEAPAIDSQSAASAAAQQPENAVPANSYVADASSGISSQETKRLPFVASPMSSARTAPLSKVDSEEAGQAVAVAQAEPSNDEAPNAEGQADVGKAVAEDPTSSEDPRDGIEPIAPEDLGFDMGEAKKPRKALKTLGIVAGSLVGLAAAVYVGGALFFNNWFLPNSTLFGQDVSLKTSDEVAAIVDDAVNGYELAVQGDNGFSYATDAEKANISVDSKAVVRNMHEGLGMWNWPLKITEKTHELDEYLQVDFDGAAVSRDVSQAVEQFNETGTDPVDACVSYDDQAHKFVVKPEEYGTKYDARAICEAIGDSINQFSGDLKLGRDQLVQPLLFSTDKKLNDDAQAANKLVSADVTLKMGDVDAGHINADQLHDLVIFDPVAVPRLDMDTVDGWVTGFVNSLDTIGKERTYTRPDDGKEITVDGGSYGWNIVSRQVAHDDIMAAVQAGGKQEVVIECNDTAAAWNGPGKQDWGKRYIDVDLSEQYVRFFDEDGDIIWETSCISGAPDGKHGTPTGVWFINRKESPSKLIGWEDGRKIYESTVRYWMPFVGNEVGLHDADWQPDFGGQMYAQGYGSHGCVNLPVYMAAELYDIVELNDVVVVHW